MMLRSLRCHSFLSLVLLVRFAAGICPSDLQSTLGSKINTGVLRESLGLGPRQSQTARILHARCAFLALSTAPDWLSAE